MDPRKKSTLAPFTHVIRVRRNWLFVVLLVSCSGLPAASLANEFERTHRSEIKKMVAASVKIETGFGRIDAEYAAKLRSNLNPKSPSLLDEGSRIQDCSDFIYAKFYTKFRPLIENVDTSAFDSIEDLRKDRTDVSILRDPRKIAYDIKYRISGLKYLKDFHPALEEFAAQYSARQDLKAKCSNYLDVTGMGN